MTFSSGDLLLVLPELLVVTAACVVLAVDPVLHPSKKDGMAWLSLGTLATCMGLTASQMSHSASAFGGLIVIDAYGCYIEQLFPDSGQCSFCFVTRRYIASGSVRLMLQRGQLLSIHFTIMGQWDTVQLYQQRWHHVGRQFTA